MTKKILIVDDEPGIIEVIVDYIKMSGLEATFFTADSVDKALALVVSKSPDLILTDIAMPGKSGLDFLREIKIRKLGIPVAIVTGYADEDMTDQAWRLGANACLRKPLSKNDLKNCVSELLLHGKGHIFEAASSPSPRLVHVMLPKELHMKMSKAARVANLSIDEWIISCITKSVDG